MLPIFTARLRTMALPPSWVLRSGPTGGFAASWPDLVDLAHLLGSGAELARSMGSPRDCCSRIVAAGRLQQACFAGSTHDCLPASAGHYHGCISALQLRHMHPAPASCVQHVHFLFAGALSLL